MSVFATPSGFWFWFGLSSFQTLKTPSLSVFQCSGFRGWCACASLSGRWLQLQEGSCVQVYVQSTFDQYLILSLN